MIKISNDKKDVRDLSFDELAEYLVSIGEKPFRAVQIFEWIYQKNAWSFTAMANLSKELRERLSKDFVLQPNVIAEKKISAEGTTKFLFDLHDREKIESVLIPTATRTTQHWRPSSRMCVRDLSGRSFCRAGSRHSVT